MAAALVQAPDAAQVLVLALDVPSGLCADTGRVGAGVRARATVEFCRPETRPVHPDGPDQAGDLHLARLDLPESLYRALADAPSCWRSATQSSCRRAQERAQTGSVSRARRGGDLHYGGAAHLCAEAALRSGAGLVSVATRGQHVAAPMRRGRKPWWRAIDGPQDLKPCWIASTSLLWDWFWGTRAWGHAHWHAVMGRRLPTVIDADALNLFRP